MKYSYTVKWPSDYHPPNWLPRWHEETEYPVPGCTSKGNYAWEFLRRNPAYQNDYSVICDLCEREDVAGRYKKSQGFDITLPSSDDNTVQSIQFHAALYRTLRTWGLAYHLLDPSLGCHDTVDFKAGGRLGEYHILPLDRIKVNCDTQQLDARRYVSVDIDHYVEQSGEEHETLEEIPLDGGIIPTGGETLWLFDFFLPIEPQIVRARETLVAVQTEINKGGKKLQASRAEIAKFNQYLRLLDADAHGVKDEEIMDILYPGQDKFSYLNAKGEPYEGVEVHTNPGRNTLRDHRKAAYYFRDQGYKLLF
jgi:hypothetical protein